MRKGRPLLAAGTLLGILAILVGHHHLKSQAPSPAANMPISQPEKNEDLDPSLAALLLAPATNDREHKSGFFTSLAALARKHKLAPKDYCLEGFVAVEEGYAVKIGAGSDLRVVAILRGDDHMIPGRDTQFLLLLDRDGRLLDRLSCAISNRLTRWVAGHQDSFRTEVHNPPEKDGAQFVIRHIPADGGSVSGNWSHELTHGGQRSSWHWDEESDCPPGVPPQPRANVRCAEWDSKGLCRVAVREGKFFILFPK